MKIIFPVSGHIIVEAEDDVSAEKSLARWLLHAFSKNRGSDHQIPELFGDSEPPGDVVIEIDHNHVTYCQDEEYRQIMEQSRRYQQKKLAKFLRKKERDLLLAALQEPPII